VTQLQPQHILLFRVLRDHCPFLTGYQIQRVLTRPKSSTNKHLGWLVSQSYLRRRYRADTFAHAQTPIYFLGPEGWRVAGKPVDDYKAYRLQIERRSEQSLPHALALHHVLLKFLLESKVKRLVSSEDVVWQERLDLGIIPDAWLQFSGEAFIEVDLATERPDVLAKKFARYLAFNESGGYGTLFPNCVFKVLVFTTTEQRIESLQRVTNSDSIWFCVTEEFLREKLDHRHWFARLGFYALPSARQKEM
jgi:hypothetical protein